MINVPLFFTNCAVPLGNTISKVVLVLLDIAKFKFSTFVLSIAKLVEFKPDVLFTPTKGLFLASLVTFVIVTALPFASMISNFDVFAIALILDILASLIAFIRSNGDTIIAALATLV